MDKPSLPEPWKTSISQEQLPICLIMFALYSYISYLLLPTVDQQHQLGH